MSFVKIGSILLKGVNEILPILYTFLSIWIQFGTKISMQCIQQLGISWNSVQWKSLFTYGFKQNFANISTFFVRF